MEVIFKEMEGLKDSGVYYISNYFEGTVYVVNSYNKKIINKIKTGVQPCDIVEEKEKIFVANSGSDTVSIIYGDKVIRNLNICNNGHIAVDLKNEKIYASDINSVSVYDLNSNICLKSIYDFKQVRFIKLDSSKNKLIVLDENNFNIYNSMSMNILKSIKVGMGASFVEISEDNSTAYISNTIDNSISIINLKSMKLIYIVENVGKGPMGLKILKDKLYVASNLESFINIIDIKSNHSIKTIPVGKAPEKITLYDNKILINNVADNSISVIDIFKNEGIDTIKGFKEPMGIVAFHVKRFYNFYSSEKAVYITTKKIFSHCSFRECFNHSTNEVYSILFQNANNNSVKTYHFKEIKFLKAYIIPESKQITPISGSYNHKLTFSFKIPYILRYTDLEGNLKTLKGSIEAVEKEIQIYIPNKRDESEIEIMIDSSSKLLNVPVFNNFKFSFGLGSFITISICCEVDLVIPYISNCKKINICEKYENIFNDFYL